MNRIIPPLLALFLVAWAVPSAQAESPADALADAARAAYDAVEPDRRTTTLEGAFQEGAHLTTISLAGEAHSKQWLDAAWEAAQYARDPQAAFLANASSRYDVLREDLQQAADALGEASGGEVTGREADALILAAHLLVDAEKSMTHGAMFLEVAKDPKAQTNPTQRYTIARPLFISISYVEAAQGIIRADVGADSRVVDQGYVLAAIEASGGAGDHWVIGEGGFLHRLARHVSGVENTIQNETQDADPDALLERLDAARETLPRVREDGLEALRLASLVDDASWWHVRSLEEYAPDSTIWQVNLRQLAGSLGGASYEADILAASLEDTSGGATWYRWAVGGGVLLGLGGLYWLRQRNRREAPEPIAGVPSRRAAPLAVLALLLATAAAGEPLPADPDDVPVAFTQSGGIAALGNVLVHDGVVHLAWSEWVDSGKHFVLRYRTHVPATDQWSDITTFRDVAQNANTPRLFLAGDELHVLWVEGLDPDDKAALSTLWWCVLEDGRCRDAPLRLSSPDHRTYQFSAHGGPDGTLHTAWSETTPPETAWAPPSGHLVYRALADGWGPEVRFDTDAQVQSDPAVSGDEGGRGHVVWRDLHTTNGASSHPVAYAAVPAAASAPAALNGNISHGADSRGSLAVLAHAGAVHVLYDEVRFNETVLRDLYHVQRPLSATEWGSPTNVSQSQAGPGWPSLHPDGSGVVAMWAEGDQETAFALRASAFMDGVWKSPLTVWRDAAYPAFVPFFDIDGEGTWHVVWSGKGPGTNGEAQMHYMRTLPEFPYEPPRIQYTSPPDGEWRRGDGLKLSIHYQSERPLDVAASSVRVGSLEAALEAEPARVVARFDAVDEGLHHVEATFVDDRGGSTTHSWNVGVDRTPPPLQSILLTSDAGDGPGWHTAPVTVDGAIGPDDGSPVSLEIQVDGRSYARLPTGGFELREGRLHDLRLRAVDAAGNVALLPVVSVGWDATPPALDFRVPGDWVGQNVRLPFEGTVTGSPLRLDAAVWDEAGQRSDLAELAMEDGAAVLPGLPEGNTTVRLDVSDAAGNRQEAGPWTFLVDATPPSVSAPLVEGVRTLRVTDAASGVAAVKVVRGSQELLDREVDGALEWPIPAGDGVRVTVRDRVGNAASVDVSATGTISAVQDEDDGGGGEPLGAAGDGRSSPAPGPAVVVALLAGLAAARKIHRPPR